ncbi:MAG: hypothetical protein WCV62_05590 [Candidatus Peribacteraceae bacterium]|jgi:hypothetical protein
MTVRYLSAFVLLALLSGCTRTAIESDCFHKIAIKDYKLIPVLCPDKPDKRTYRNSLFSITFPSNTFAYIDGQDEDQVAFQTTLDAGHAQSNDFVMNISFTSNSSLKCSDALRDAATEKRDFNGMQAFFGKVQTQTDSFIRNSMSPDIEYPLVCMPINNSTNIAYAFCTEKEGKQAVICLTQVTDNPQLAEEIFKTFRWTE